MVPRLFVGMLVACHAGGSSDSGLLGPSDPLPRGSLVIPDDEGLTFLGLDGIVVDARRWPSLVGDCAVCSGEGASADGDGLLLSYTTSNGSGGVQRPGAISRIDARGRLDVRVDGFGFPHDVIRDPTDGSLMIVATATNELVWIDGDGRSNRPIRTLGDEHPEFPPTPNGADLLQWDGRTYVLLSHRPMRQGRITLWDITEPGSPTFVWRFPSVGRLGLPHGPILREIDGAWWLLWAHTRGAGGDGTIGLAVSPAPTVAPTYVADLQPGADVERFRFLRGVELLDDGRLIATDSGELAFGVGRGRIFSATFPDLGPPVGGEGGGLGDQVFVPLGPASLMLDELAAPFEAWYWR